MLRERVRGEEQSGGWAGAWTPQVVGAHLTSLSSGESKEIRRCSMVLGIFCKLVNRLR